MFTQAFLWRTLVLSAWLFSGQTQAVTIQYEVSDLPDLLVGQDLWQYRYQVSGSFAALDGFNLLFDPTLYSHLEDPPSAPNADWSVATTPPFAGADTLYTATALTDSPSLAERFTVSFVRIDSASGTPGTQNFEVFDGNFNIVETGTTTLFAGPSIPEPGTLLLLAGALGLLHARKRFFC